VPSNAGPASRDHPSSRPGDGAAPRATRPSAPTGLGTILGIWAHPDDEVYLSGGLMAAARDAGQRVVCITATRGEHGTDDPTTWPPELLGERREHEARRSLALLGVEEHRFLDIEDGRCAAEPLTSVIEVLSAIIDEIRPDTILTFGPDGMTGHEDHQTVSRWVTGAQAATAPGARLLYATTTADHAEKWQELHDDLGVFLVPDLPLRHPSGAVDIEFHLDATLADRKFAALRAQASQTAGPIARIGARRFRDWCSVEAFIAAEAVPARRWQTWAAQPARGEA
jgi:LmbE family N-acetylglucosaminyl deacetylase